MQLAACQTGDFLLAAAGELLSWQLRAAELGSIQQAAVFCHSSERTVVAELDGRQAGGAGDTIAERGDTEPSKGGEAQAARGRSPRGASRPDLTSTALCSSSPRSVLLLVLLLLLLLLLLCVMCIHYISVCCLVNHPVFVD